MNFKGPATDNYNVAITKTPDNPFTTHFEVGILLINH
jgi:hypothetical protein